MGTNVIDFMSLFSRRFLHTSGKTSALFGGLQPPKRPADVVEFLVGEHRVVLASMHAHHVLEGLEDAVLERAHRFGHHAKALVVRCAQARSMPEGPAERGVEADAKSVDGVEHSAILKCVMARQIASG
jgi:hypothetical protein